MTILRPQYPERAMLTDPTAQGLLSRLLGGSGNLTNYFNRGYEQL